MSGAGQVTPVAGPPLYAAEVTARSLAAQGWRAAWCRESASYGAWRSYSALMSADYRRGQCLLDPVTAAIVERIAPEPGSGRTVEPHWREDLLSAAVRDGALDLAVYGAIRWAPVVTWRRDLAAYVRAARRVMAQATDGASVDGSAPAPSRWRPSRVALWSDQADASVRAALRAAVTARAIETRPGWLLAMAA